MPVHDQLSVIISVCLSRHNFEGVFQSTKTVSQVHLLDALRILRT